jgi:hypothetical protein
LARALIWKFALDSCNRRLVDFPAQEKTGLQVLHRTTERCLISTAHKPILPRPARFRRKSAPSATGPIPELTPCKSGDWKSAFEMNPSPGKILAEKFQISHPAPSLAPRSGANFGSGSCIPG